MPKLIGSATILLIIKVSFSPASIAAPSSLNKVQSFLLTLLISLGQPLLITKLLKASLVPEVGGGTNTAILMFGKLESMSDHFLGNEPFADKACHSCSCVKFIGSFLSERIIAIPSKPTITCEISVTPFSKHICFSFGLMAREAFVISGVLTPIPLQNNFIPPPVPVDSITGVLIPFLPTFSATTVENGNTVEEPTIDIWSLAYDIVVIKDIIKTNNNFLI